MILVFGYCTEKCEKINLEEVNKSECEIRPEMFPERVINFVKSKQTLNICRHCEKIFMPGVM